jgi:hypothetical protein
LKLGNICLRNMVDTSSDVVILLLLVWFFRWLRRLLNLITTCLLFVLCDATTSIFSMLWRAGVTRTCVKTAVSYKPYRLCSIDACNHKNFIIIYSEFKVAPHQRTDGVIQQRWSCDDHNGPYIWPLPLSLPSILEYTVRLMMNMLCCDTNSSCNMTSLKRV